MENEIKVGDYIRTKDGIIDKIVDIRDTYSERKLIALEKSNSLRLDIGLKTMVVKHSPNLIDIIEEGDYVNGEVVYKIFNPYFLSFGELPYIITANYNNKYEPHEIEEIVTHEQFESVSYKVEE